MEKRDKDGEGKFKESREVKRREGRDERGRVVWGKR